MATHLDLPMAKSMVYTNFIGKGEPMSQKKLQQAISEVFAELNKMSRDELAALIERGGVRDFVEKIMDPKRLGRKPKDRRITPSQAVTRLIQRFYR